MRYLVYKPNSKNTGCAVSFNMFTDKDGEMVMFLNAIQQASWDDKTKTGSFAANRKDPTKSASVMFNLTECGAMLYAFNSRTPKNFYHKTPKGTKSITLSPWDKEAKVMVKGKENVFISHAFGMSITVDGSSNYSIPFEPGEIENIKSLITAGMLSYYSKAEKYDERKEIEDSPVQESDY